ncbi:MAG TPA: hypothetical protein VHH88_04145 [Verrucomicrobiae bacterium]|nr:hypothetical protein [Verrucomicrobiae bacterium]
MDTSEMREQAKDWKQTAQEAAEDFQEQAGEWKRKAGERARQTGQVIDQYVRENTWMSIATIAAVSCVLGFLIGRSRD